MSLSQSVRAKFARAPISLRAMSTGASVAALAAVVAFITNILMSRALGPSARGQVAFVLQMAYLMSPLMMLGVDRTLLRSDASKDQQAARRHLLVVALILGIALVVIFRDQRALAAPIAYALSWIALARSCSFREGAFRAYVQTIAAYQVFVLAASVTFYAVGVDNWIVWLAPYLVPAVAICLYDIATDFRRRLRRTFAGVSAASLKVLPSAIATTIILRAERVIMPLASSDAQLGIYVAVATATEVIAWLANSLADHRVARLSGSNRPHGRALLRILIRDGVLFCFPAGLVGAATYWLLIPLLGSSFDSGRSLVAPLCLAAVILALHRQVNAWQLAGRWPGGVTVSTGAAAVVAVPVYIWAIAQAGALGAAWACVGVYTIALTAGLIMVALETRGKQAHLGPSPDETVP
jgi:O-antigen/teichoic acid export membrane protein